MSNTATVAQLRRKIDQMQAPKIAHKTLPTDAALTELFAGGSLLRGCSYAVTGSVQLALTLIAQASAEGVWCGIVGLPELGIEAAHDLGVRLDRLVLVPDPGPHTLSAVSSLAEVLGAVVTGPLRLSAHQSDTLTGRLRDTQATLITVTPPRAAGGAGGTGGPGAARGRAGSSTGSPSDTAPRGGLYGVEAHLTATASRWRGLSQGFGVLAARELAVESRDRGGLHSCLLRFEGHRVCRVDRGRTEPGRTEPGRTEPGRAELNLAAPGRAEPGRVQPGPTELSFAEPGRAGRTGHLRAVRSS